MTAGPPSPATGLIQSFLDAMAAERGASRNTIDAYRRDLDDNINGRFQLPAGRPTACFRACSRDTPARRGRCNGRGRRRSDRASMPRVASGPDPPVENDFAGTGFIIVHYAGLLQFFKLVGPRLQSGGQAENGHRHRLRVGCVSQFGRERDRLASLDFHAGQLGRQSHGASRACSRA